jgi:predicted phage terminase large subunit-like protein
VIERIDWISLPDLNGHFAMEQARRRKIRTANDREGALAECQSLEGFVRHAWHVLEPTQPYVHGWHIEAICHHLEAVTDGFIRRLLINVPPGTMKSLLVSVLWPAWEWGPRGLPNMRYLATSYEQELVIRDNRRMRDLVESEWYQSLWGDTVQLARDRRGQRRFANTAKGGRDGRAIGSMTGGRGDRVIIDDPHSTKTAESDAVRGEVTRLFREAIPSRVNNPETSAIVVIMQRLHTLDVSGVAIAMNQGYVHLRLPMEYEATPEYDDAGRQIAGPCTTRLGPGRSFEDPRTEDGELLFEARFPRWVIETDKRIMGEYAVAGQFQQRPIARDGALFATDNILTVTGLPKMEKLVRGWDFAGTKKKQGNNPDWTAGVLLGRGVDKRFYIIDVQRFQERPGVVREKIKAISAADGSEVIITIPKDPAQAGIDQVEAYARALAGHILRPRAPTGDKELRATPFATVVDLNQVRMLKGPWNEKFIAELRTFPSGANDDQVDAIADAFNELTGLVPGEGLMEFYRQEAERAAREEAGMGPAKTEEGTIPIRPPPQTFLVTGIDGDAYRPDAKGLLWVKPVDANMAYRPGWSPVELDPGED